MKAFRVTKEGALYIDSYAPRFYRDRNDHIQQRKCDGTWQIQSVPIKHNRYAEVFEDSDVGRYGGVDVYKYHEDARDANRLMLNEMLIANQIEENTERKDLDYQEV